MPDEREYRHPLFRLWDIPLAVIAVVLALIGVDVLVSFHWTPRVETLPDGEAFYYPWRAVLLVAVAGVVLIAVGFIVGMERQFHNWLVLSMGVCLLTLGTSYVAMERVTITDDGFAVRRWWGLQSHSWRYDELQSITVVNHHRRKGVRWVTVRCRFRGTPTAVMTEEIGAPRLMDSCLLALRERASAKGVGVAPVLETH